MKSIPANSTPFHAWHFDKVLEHLKSTKTGLSAIEAEARLREYGENVLPRAKAQGPLRLLWNQINTPLIWVLIGSSFIAMIVDPDGGIKNGIVILAVVILNTLIGFIQEYRAGQAIAALVDMVPETTTVLRDGDKAVLPASQLVPGDVVLLASGDKVPADMRILEEKNLQAIESALTGESLPSRKAAASVPEEADLGDRSSQIFGGTLVTYGTTTAVVTATGAHTELGRISSLLNEVADLQTPLTKGLAAVGRALTIAIIFLSLALLALGTWRTMSETGIDLVTALRETTIFAITLAVGAVPEGLPAIVTITLAIGVQRMAARRAVIRKLPAVETLGSTTVICTDKTGTLTRNEMTVQELWTANETIRVSGVGYAPHGQFTKDSWATERLPHGTRRLLENAALCNDSSLVNEEGTWTITGDPTEGALLTVAAKGGLDLDDVRDLHKRVDSIPFESENQFMATLHEDTPETNRLILKGAPEVIIKRCLMNSDLTPQHVANEVKRLASQGMRVLAVAEKTMPASQKRIEARDVEEGLTLVGLQGMIDPPRTEAMEAIKACHNAGITVKMITGDHRETAQTIGRQLGLLKVNESALNGHEIGSMSDVDLAAAAHRTNVFARVAPEHKLRLVKALQSSGHIVAMTGDGVNDAPALKQSNIGIAMGITGTAVSKESADVVLTDDNFSSIEAAVEEGRRVYDNLVKSLAFVLPTNLGLALILVYAVLFFPFQNGELLVPMLPAQILWINLVATVTLALPLAFEAKEPNIMRRPPRDPKEPVLSSFVVTRTFVAAILMTAGAVGLFSYEYRSALSSGASEAPIALAKAQTMAVTTVIMFQIFYLLNCRSLRATNVKIGLFSNKTVYVGIVTLVALQFAFIYWSPLQNLFGTTNLSLRDLGMTALIGAVILPVISFEKWYRNRRLPHEKPTG